MSAAQFRYTIRLSGTDLALDVRDSTVRAAACALNLAIDRGLPIEVVRGDDTGDKTRICQVFPDAHIDWFMPPEAA